MRMLENYEPLPPDAYDFPFKKRPLLETSLVVQWLGLHGGSGVQSLVRELYPHATAKTQHGQIGK